MKRITAKSVPTTQNIYRNNNLYHCHRFAFVILFWLGSFNESQSILWPRETQQKKKNYYDDHWAERKSVIMFVVMSAHSTQQTQNIPMKLFVKKISEWISLCKVSWYCLHLITDGDHYSKWWWSSSTDLFLFSVC